jgi:hypothetical protein
MFINFKQVLLTVLNINEVFSYAPVKQQKYVTLIKVL